jgi:hypothetical protein
MQYGDGVLAIDEDPAGAAWAARNSIMLHGVVVRT